MIKRGQLRSPLRHLFYGPGGVGKSTLASDAPNPLFFDIEGGGDNLDIARYPFRDDENGHVPLTYDEVAAALSDLIANGGRGYQTLVVDTIDALEALIHKHICTLHGKANVEDFGFGKGYKVALGVFREFMSLLDALRAKGVQIVLLGHVYVKTFKDPIGEDFDRYQLRIHEQASAQLREWSDVVGFVRFEGGSAKLANDTAQTKRARGWSTGRRIVHLAHEAAWDAKCRLSLPAELELDVAHPWAPFAEAKLDARDATLESLTAEIHEQLVRVTGGDLAAEFTTSRGDRTTGARIVELLAKISAAGLARILAGLKSTTSIVPTQES